MKYLAIDTSGKNLTIAVCDGTSHLVYSDENCGVKHSVELMVKTEEMLNKINLTLDDLDFIAAVVGAGSFTGIRIGVSTVKALCFAKNLPYLSITSFDTIAYNKKSGKVMAVINAGHGGFYACAYSDGKVVLPPCYILKEDLLSLNAEYEFLAFEEIEGLNVTVVSVAEGLVKAIESNLDKVSSNLDDLAPLYVRKSQAEEGRP